MHVYIILYKYCIVQYIYIWWIFDKHMLLYSIRLYIITHTSYIIYHDISSYIIIHHHIISIIYQSYINHISIIYLYTSIRYTSVSDDVDMERSSPRPCKACKGLSLWAPPMTYETYRLIGLGTNEKHLFWVLISKENGWKWDNSI